MAVREALAVAGLPVEAGELRVLLALSGAPEWLTPELADSWWADAGLRVHLLGAEDDHRAAWAAALFPDPCVWLLLGTYWGSRAIVRGEEVSHPLDDNDLDVVTAARGEPHWLGSALLALTVEKLVRGVRDELVDAVLDWLRVDDLEALLRWSRRHDGKDERARPLPLIGRLARGRNREAAGLLGEGATQLAEATGTMVRYLGLLDTPVTVVLCGNAWRIGAPLAAPFLDRLSMCVPQARVVRPALSQAQGAALLAMRADGVADLPLWSVAARQYHVEFPANTDEL